MTTKNRITRVCFITPTSVCIHLLIRLPFRFDTCTAMEIFVFPSIENAEELCIGRVQVSSIFFPFFLFSAQYQVPKTIIGLG